MTVTDIQHLDKYLRNTDSSYFLNSIRNFSLPPTTCVFADNFPLNRHQYVTPKFTICSMNIRSIPSNLQFFQEMILDNVGINLDVIGFVETRLDKDIEKLYTLPGYDRHTLSRNRSGGGVAIYASSILNSSKLDNLAFSNDSIECLCVEITIKFKTSLLICVYRPPNSNFNKFIENLQHTLETVSKKYKSIYAFGDFNIDLTKDCNATKEFKNIMYMHSYLQLISKPTRITDTTSSLIDHNWTTNFELNTSNLVLHNDISDHFVIVSQFDIETHPPKNEKYIHKRVISDQKIELFRQELSNENWESVLKSECPNEAYNIFSCRFLELFHKHFKICEVKINNKKSNKQYINSGLRNCIREKHRLERLASKWPITYKEKYKAYRNMLTRTLRQAKNEYYKELLSSTQGNPKKHWEIINNILGRNGKQTEYLPDLKNKNINLANVFNNHFLSLGNISVSCSDKEKFRTYFTENISSSLFLKPVDDAEVLKLLKNVSSNSPGYDEIPPKLIMKVSSEIVIPLTHIINESFSKGAYPDNLKIAKVIPIFKSGDLNDVNNFRPISLLPAFNKIFEKCLSYRLVNYLESKSLISANQFGFRSNRSTETAILNFVAEIYKCLDQGDNVVGIFLDLSKAFDSLNHDILFHKLENLGIRGVSLKLFRSYLKNRSQSVYYDNTFSTRLNIHKGVPQGSVLGPILFLIYINDIEKASNEFKFTMYADDTSLIISDKNKGKLHAQCQFELEKINQWIESNFLKLNIKKTNYIFFQNRSKHETFPDLKLNGHVLLQSQSTKFLGVLIDDHINWNKQIDYICDKICRTCGVLYKIKRFLTDEAMRSLYFTLVYSHLIYCVSIWSFTWPSFVRKISVAQNKIIRCIMGMKKFESTKSTYQSAKILPYDYICKYFSNILIYRLLTQSSVNKYFIRTDSTQRIMRNINDIVVPKFRTTLFQNCFLHKGAEVWNELPQNLKSFIVTNSLNGFKIALKKHLLSDMSSNT